MSWEQWENPETRATWNEALDAIERATAEFSRSRQTETSLTRCHQDSPDVTMKWTDGSALRNLQFVVASASWPLPVRFLGHVWRDSGAEREFRAIDFGTVEYESAEALSSRFPADLGAAFDQSAGLKLTQAAAGD